MPRFNRTILFGQALRFLLSSGFNTILTFIVYELLLPVSGYRLAYLAAFIVGLIATLSINIRLVFRQQYSVGQVLGYGAYNCAYSGVFVTVLGLTVELLKVPGAWAPVLVLMVITPPHFLLSRLLVTGNRRSKREASLSAKDIACLAELQGSILPGSLISRVGRSCAAAYWRYADTAVEERVFVRRAADDSIAAACSLSYHPGSLTRRLATRTPLAFFAVRHILSPWLWQAIWEVVAGAGTPEMRQLVAQMADIPEVVMLLTHPGHRRKGLARSLLKEVETQLRQQGVRCYYVRAEDGKDDTLQFYGSCGFRFNGKFEAHGLRYVMLKNDLDLIEDSQMCAKISR
ncbi:MAG: GNAT family N-acetyltransferase [Alphaproteobacteria bacterium]|nr:GNAT family N-acetyltransferase [Alphaproteobacteria bacterium]